MVPIRNNDGPAITNVNVPGRGIVVGARDFRGSDLQWIPIGIPAVEQSKRLWLPVLRGHRNKREPSILPNQPPTASLAASTTTIILPCPPDTHSSGACANASSTTVGLTTTASDPDGDTLLYTYNRYGWPHHGEGTNVSWDLSGVGPGTYTASVEVDDGCGCINLVDDHGYDFRIARIAFRIWLPRL